MMTPVQVGPGAYQKGSYGSLERFISYYYQIELVRRVNPKTILFVGVGDGMVTDFLKKNKEYQLTTIDIDVRLAPDVVADMRTLPFEDEAFDMVCVFEVLEHLPFEESKKALAELARVSRIAVAVSVPHRRTGLAIAFKFPFIRTLFGRTIGTLALLFPVRFPGFAVSKQHYWEIDWWTTTVRAVRSMMRTHFRIIDEFTPPLNHYHHFFLLEPLKDGKLKV